MICHESPSLCVCIITYQRPEGLRRLLDALVPQIKKRPERSVVVVNDGSHDEKYSVVTEKFSSYVSYHPLEQNSGIVRARNESVRQTDSDFVVFIDDDCLPPPFWLDWLAAQLKAYPELDVIAGITRPLLPDNPTFFARVQAHFGFYPNPDRIQDQIRFVTANLAIRRKLFWELGGFRHHENFPGASEDTELSSRVSRSDCFRRIDHDWYVFHDMGDGLRTNMRRYWRYGYANIWLHQFTISPPYHDHHWAEFAKENQLSFFLRVFRRNFKEARSAFPSTLNRLYASLLASLVNDAYRAGCRAARKSLEQTQVTTG